jgi:two-component system, NarL family, sensor histidine kinase BarA
MGGYRSLKRVLGESNLERKCRWLFGICVGGLILLAFWWVDRVSEGLIEATAASKGRDLVRFQLFDLHWQFWTYSDEGEFPRRTVAQNNRDLAVDKFDARILSLDDSVRNSKIEIAKVFPAANQQERELLEQLKRDAESKLLGFPLQGSSPRAAAPLPPKGPAERIEFRSASDDADDANSEPVSRAIRYPSAHRYDYYQVVYWSAGCIDCHQHMYGQYSQSAAASVGGAFDPARAPFRVVRVTMPDTDIRDAINRTRAILLAVGIVTVFLAMVALYYVVKYIVIKPLNHLREVSDEVARGNLHQRADIHTNDEFEDLAASFNKMLVHLVETQGELQDANTELDQKVDQLAHLNMQLHEMNRLKGEFLATMSHELRTPLNSIIGFSEVLQSLEALNDKQKRYAQNIQKSGRQLLDMINDILDLAKMEAGKMEVRLSEFRMDLVIANQIDLVREMAEDKNIDLRTEIEGDLPLLYQDQGKVQQILTNLLSNAIKFTPEGGRITVGARGNSRGQIEFWVSDTGVGIPPAEKEIIFEKFRQGNAALGRDNLTREFSGTGLGLSIVKELCRLLGGEVSVESELGKGSTFRVIIPWMRTDTAAAAAKLAARLDDVNRPRRLESLRGDTAPEVAAAGHG